METKNVQNEPVNPLMGFRMQLNEIDAAMTKLFEKRMNIIHDLAIYKMEQNLSVYDPTREQEMINRYLNQIQNETYKQYYKMFLENVLVISKEYQMAIRQKK